MDTQITELLGRNRLIDDLLRAGLEVAIPERDRGVDLIAYVDLEEKVPSFVARPIQMKASSRRGFGINRKYERIAGLILAYVWHLEDRAQAISYALYYQEAVSVADRMGWTSTPSWRDKGTYTTSSPSARLTGLLEPYIATVDNWWEKVVTDAT